MAAGAFLKIINHFPLGDGTATARDLFQAELTILPACWCSVDIRAKST
jgi:hypothetical protein